MAKYTLHSESGDFLHRTFRKLDTAKLFCDKQERKYKVYETYYAKSPWRPWDDTLVEHGREVYRNF